MFECDEKHIIYLDDIVQINNPGAIYSSYNEWAKKHKLEFWRCRRGDLIGYKEGRVVAIGEHLSWTNRTLIAVRVLEYDNSYLDVIINANGVEIIKESNLLEDDLFEI